MQDDARWLERYQQLWAQHRDRQLSTRELVQSVLSAREHWEQDLTQVSGLVDRSRWIWMPFCLRACAPRLNRFANAFTRLRPGLNKPYLVTTYYVLCL